MSRRTPDRRRRPVILIAVVATVLALGVLLVRSAALTGPEREAKQTASRTDEATDPDRTAGPTHDPGDPVTAAVQAAAAPQEWLYLTDEEIRAAVLDLATEDAGPALADLTVANLAEARENLTLSPGPVWWLVHPLATRLVGSTATSAEVEVWTVTVLSAVEVAAPQAEWMTVTVDLAAEAGEWRVESIRDRPGPSPMLGPHDQPWNAAPFGEDLTGFDRLDGSVLDGEVTS